MSAFVDSSSYVDTYGNYRKGMLEPEEVWMKDKIVPGVVSTLSKKFACNKDQPLKILSVGSGFGDADLILLKEINKQIVQSTPFDISYTVVEMNKGFMDCFKRSAEESKEELSNVEFTWLLSDFETFMAEREESMKFHFIVMFHVLYYMDAERALQRSMSDLLLPGGCIWAVVLTEESLSKVVFQKYSNVLKGTWINVRILSDQELVEIAKRNGWKFESFVGARNTKISAVFRPETPEGRLMINFFFHTNDLLEQLNETQLKDIYEFFTQRVISDNTNTSPGLYAVNNDGVVLLYKE